MKPETVFLLQYGFGLALIVFYPKPEFGLSIIIFSGFIYLGDVIINKDI